MKKLIPVALLGVLLMTACSNAPDDNPILSATAETPPTVESTPQPSEMIEAAPEANEADEQSTVSVGAIVRGSMLPDWESDFSVDGFISFDRLAWHIENAGSDFRMIGTQPLEFSDGRFVLSIDQSASTHPEFVTRPFTIFDANRSVSVSDVGVNDFHMRNNAVDRTLAIRIWDTFAILDDISDISEITGAADRVRMMNSRRDARSSAHERALNERKRQIEELFY